MCGGEGDPSVVELEEAREVEEVTLCGFGSQVAGKCIGYSVGRAEGRGLPGMLAGGTDAAFEHEIKLLRLAHLVVGVRISDVVFDAQLSELGARVVVELNAGSAVDSRREVHEYPPEPG